MPPQHLFDSSAQKWESRARIDIVTDDLVKALDEIGFPWDAVDFIDKSVTYHGNEGKGLHVQNEETCVGDPDDDNWIDWVPSGKIYSNQESVILSEVSVFTSRILCHPEPDN